MEQILKDKIKQLHAQGLNSARDILKALTTKEQIATVSQVSREAKKWEAKLMAVLIPAVVTISEIKAIPRKDRKEYIADKLIAQYNSLGNALLKANHLMNSQLINLYMTYAEQAGSTGFDDPDFNKSHSDLNTFVAGESFIEKNDIEEPTLEEIRGAIKNG